MMIKYETRITPEQYEISLRRVFEIFDLDKNSFITETELKEVMGKLGNFNFIFILNYNLISLNHVCVCSNY